MSLFFVIGTTFRQIDDSRGAIFSEGMKQFSYILGGVVIGIYLLVFAVDVCIRYKNKRNKIGDFRQGMVDSIFLPFQSPDR